MRVLLVGSGGREHALAWKIAQSPRLKKLYCAPGNPGTSDLTENVDIKPDDIAGIVKFAKDQHIDMVVIGPENPLCAGLVDALTTVGIRAFGPDRSAARIEGDKAFAKELMRHRSVPTADARIFDKYKDARAYIASRDHPVVLKASGLAAGKGVVVCDDPADALIALERIMVDREFGSAGEILVVEEKLVGPEVSLLAFVDRDNIYIMETAQDHKPIGEGDTGPNTGGMGAYSPTTLLDDRLVHQVEAEIIVPMIDAMRTQGITYRGILYTGLMLTAAGPKALEFNCRFGDPETQPLLMRLKTDLLDIFDAVIDDKLDRITLQWDPRPAVCVVMSSGGYPGKYENGKPISGLEAAAAKKDVMVFHAGTRRMGGNIVTAGGRVLGVTALGDTVAAAQKRAYEACAEISWDGAYYRRDIAAKAIR